MTALEAALTILWQGMLGIFAVMALITLIVMLFRRSSAICTSDIPSTTPPP